jgi:hypothetical protein
MSEKNYIDLDEIESIDNSIKADFEINPFDVEFDKEDVVQSKTDDELEDEFDDFRDSDEEQKEIEIEEDDYSFNYDEDLYRDKAFHEEYIEVDKTIAEEEKQKKAKFKDFLYLPKIAGRKKGKYSTHLIPAEYLVEGSDTIEIVDDYSNDSEEEHKETRIITNKNSEGEIISIEVHCSCGNKTVIRLDYDEESEIDTSLFDSILDKE